MWKLMIQVFVIITVEEITYGYHRVAILVRVRKQYDLFMHIVLSTKISHNALLGNGNRF